MTTPAQDHIRASGQPKSRIPTFRSIEEEAEFWDTHSSAEFEDELEEVADVMFVKAGPKKAMTVRLDEKSLAALTQQARAKGISPSTLVRMWILERLRSTSPG